jgi:putative Mg2+ transporter-C (MgtC) family protein
MRSLLIEFSTTQRETLSLLAAKFNSKDYNVVSYQLDERTLGEVTTYHVTMVIKSRKRNADESILLSLLQDYKDITVHRME